MMEFLRSGVETFEKGYKIEDLISERTKKVLKKKVLFNPLDEFAGFVSAGYSIFDPAAVVQGLEEGLLKVGLYLRGESPIEIWVERELLSRVIIHCLTKETDDVGIGQGTVAVALGFDVDVNMLTGVVKIDSFTEDLNPGTLGVLFETFEKPETVKKGFDTALNTVYIEEKLRKLKDLWHGKSAIKYRRMHEKLITVKNAYARVRALNISKKEKDRIWMKLKERFQGRQEVSLWELYIYVIQLLTGVSFMKDKDMRRLVHKAFEGKTMTCYNGEPHEFIGM